MAGDVQAEQLIVTGISEFLRDHLQDEFTRLGVGLDAPDELNGYGDDITINTRDGASQIIIWCDNMATIHWEKNSPMQKGPQGFGVFYEQFQGGIAYTFSARRNDNGEIKRRAGEAIRRMVYGYIHQYVPTAHKVMLWADYRFGTDRMQGGSRRGLKGNLKEPGDLKDTIIIGVQMDIKVELLRAGPGVNFA